MAFRDITLGTYVYGESFLHRLDPRTKLGALVLFTTGMMAGDGWAALAAAGLFVLLACAVSGIRTRYLVRSLMPFKWLIAATFLLNVLFTGGRILVEGPLPYGGVTVEGVAAGAVLSFRLLFLVTAASLLTLTTQPVVLVAGVERLLGPFRRFGLRPHNIALAMVITIRFIPVLIDEAVKIRKSHIARGFRPDRNLAARMRGVSLLLIPLFTSTVRRAEELAVAMECRLFRSTAVRTRFFELKMAGRDWSVLVTMLLLAPVMAVI